MSDSHISNKEKQAVIQIGISPPPPQPSPTALNLKTINSCFLFIWLPLRF